jgi:hypothetical protein
MNADEVQHSHRPSTTFGSSSSGKWSGFLPTEFGEIDLRESDCLPHPFAASMSLPVPMMTEIATSAVRASDDLTNGDL